MCELRSKYPGPVPTHVPPAVRTLRPTCQHKIGTNLPLKRSAELTLHRQRALRSDVTLKGIVLPQRLGKTVANGQIHTWEAGIGASWAHLPDDNGTVISIEGGRRVGGRT